MKIAVLGCGSWGPNWVRNFSQLNKVDELYCCDPDTKKLDRLKHLFPSIKGIREYKELIKMPDLDGVAITTPVYSHFPLAKEFLEQGKHVLVEKPLSHSLESASELVNLAEGKNGF